ncbi:MAG: apolipoprotein N-acyltransferase [Bacteroidota bacterium]
MKKVLIALLSGILLAAAWPTYGFAAFAFIGFVPLLYLEYLIKKESPLKTKWKVFGLSYLSFFVWNVLTTAWIYYSTAFGMAFAILVNSLLMALVFLLYHLVAKRVNFTAAGTFFISSWICFEKLHLNWEFSWPWLNLGNVFSEYINWVQWYEYTGSFGGSLWVLLTNYIIFKIVLLYQDYKEKGIIYRGIIRVLAVIIIPIIASYLIKPSQLKPDEYIEVLALQPNIDPYNEKYFTNDRQIKSLLIELSEEKISPNTDLLLLPETVFADGTKFDRYEVSQAHLFTTEMLEKYPQLNILGGISAHEIIRDENKIGKQTNYLQDGVWFNDFNAAFFKNKTSATEFYYKSKLVVGVENFPYQSLLRPILGDVMIDLGGTVAMKTTQEERSHFETNKGVTIAPIICYESVYGEYVGDYVKNGADVLGIITNDAWWDETQGHQQHWSYAKIRAVETRKSVARSANTGISGFIDADGSVISRTQYDEKTSISTKLPVYKKLSFYVQYGDYIARVVQFLALFIFLFALAKKRK